MYSVFQLATEPANVNVLDTMHFEILYGQLWQRPTINFWKHLVYKDLSQMTYKSD